MARRCDQHSVTDACKRQVPLHKRSNLAPNLPNQLSASGREREFTFRAADFQPRAFGALG
jgi:hypothetical protein